MLLNVCEIFQMLHRHTFCKYFLSLWKKTAHYFSHIHTHTVTHSVVLWNKTSFNAQTHTPRRRNNENTKQAQEYKNKCVSARKSGCGYIETEAKVSQFLYLLTNAAKQK